MWIFTPAISKVHEYSTIYYILMGHKFVEEISGMQNECQLIVTQRVINVIEKLLLYHHFGEIEGQADPLIVLEEIA